VIGFAAETENLIAHATAKLHKKGCDWIVANDVSPASGTFGGAENSVHVIDAAGVDSWPRMRKDDVAARLAARIADHLEGGATS
jgi:phosphopantothenoylcysteine decarboxylase/phosphopantothenate--cysteine ligase